jgi:hypothetical protein
MAAESDPISVLDPPPTVLRPGFKPATGISIVVSPLPRHFRYTGRTERRSRGQTTSIMQVESSRDKDYSFARLCDLKPNLTLKM